MDDEEKVKRSEIIKDGAIVIGFVVLIFLIYFGLLILKLGSTQAVYK